MAIWWKGSGLKTRLLHPAEDGWEYRLGIHTQGFVASNSDPRSPTWQGHYLPTSYRDLFKLLKHVDLGPEDVFMDLGCGLGRTVFVADWLGARRSIGVEIDPSFAQACRDNLARRRRASQGTSQGIDFIEAPAQEIEHAQTSVLFMFHPFGRGTLEQVLARLRESVERTPRRLRLVYHNPVFDDTLAASGFLRQTDHWKATSAWTPGSMRYAASFWEA
jgi:SAM-dependent methyltransferase